MNSSRASSIEGELAAVSSAERLLHQFHRNDRCLRQGNVLSHHVLQLAHIARPVTGGEQLHRLRGVDLVTAAIAGDPGQEMRHQQRYVLAPPVERRHFDVDDVQAVIEILAELTAGDEA